jgi:hypothetical protein
LSNASPAAFIKPTKQFSGESGEDANGNKKAEGKQKAKKKKKGE